MMMNKKKPFSLHLDVDSFMPATAEEKEVISRMRPSSTFFRDGVKRLLKNKVATISLILIVLITLSSIIIPMFWPYSYDRCWDRRRVARWTTATTTSRRSSTARRN